MNKEEREVMEVVSPKLQNSPCPTTDTNVPGHLSSSLFALAAVSKKKHIAIDEVFVNNCAL